MHRCYMTTHKGSLNGFDEDQNDVNDSPQPSQSPDLNPFVHQWEILESCVCHSAFNYHHQNIKWENIFWNSDVHLSNRDSEICAKAFGGLWWSYALRPMLRATHRCTM